MNAERIKSIEIAAEQHFKFLGSLGILLLIAMAVWYFWSARSSANMAGATNAEVIGVVQELRSTVHTLNDKIAAVDVTKLNRQADDFHSATVGVTKLVASVRSQSEQLSSAATARINQLGENLASVKSVTDEAKHQIKQNGDASEKLLSSLNKTVGDVDTKFTKLLDDGSLILETANPRVKNLLDHSTW